jgi:outer membrane lipase/esterase
MRVTHAWRWSVAAALAGLTVACGGGSGSGVGGQAAATSANACVSSAAATAASTSAALCGTRKPSPEIRFSSLVSFGDSLSDVGTYAVGSVISLGGGGKFTINSPRARVWVEDIADELDLPAPCAYETGLNGISAPLDFNVPVTVHAGCTAYGQGGARVTNPVGPGNAALGGDNVVSGWLTVPIVAQVDNHLQAVGGRFRGDELVLVLAGANDAIIHLSLVGAGAETPQQGVAAMVEAATELAGDVRQLILGNGAKYVVAVNLPDLSLTPRIVGANAAAPGIQALANAMVTAFNATLQGELAGSGVLLVDAYSASRDQIANPYKYELINVTTPACNLSASTNPLGSSLMCNDGNLQPGLSPDAAAAYAFSDDIHPTPYRHRLLAKLVEQAMDARGWL